MVNVGYKKTYARRGGYQYTQPYKTQQTARRRATARSKFRQQGNPYVEKKGMDTVITFNDIISTTTTNANIIVLNLVQPGTGSWNRIGKRVNPSSLRVKGQVRFESEQDVQGDQRFVEGTVLRMTIVHDNQPSGNTVPVFSDMFGQTSQTGTESVFVWDSIRYDNTDRFTILRDKFIDLNPSATPGLDGAVEAASYQTFWCDEYIQLKQKAVVYSGQSNPMTIADISTGAYYLVCRTFANEAHTNTAFVGTCRFRYTD